MDVNAIAHKLNEMYPGRDWDQQCQRLVWNVVWLESGVPEGRMTTYATATDARLASTLVSNNASRAPEGAIHYWLRPAEGHVGISLGGGAVLMTGTPYALGTGGYQLGRNYGVTTVSAYTSRMGNPYLGWSETNGANPLIITPSSDPSTKVDRTSKVSLFHVIRNGKVTFALAGESPGTSANWLETQDQNFANKLAKQHGNSAELSEPSWNEWKARYLEPLNLGDRK